MFRNVRFNHLAVITVAVFQFLFGWLWFSPMMFGHMWMSQMHMNAEHMKMMGTGPLAVCFAAGLVFAYVLAWFLHVSGYYDAKRGSCMGFMVWLGFWAPKIVMMHTFHAKPVNYTAMMLAYNLIIAVVAGAILGAWKPKH